MIVVLVGYMGSGKSLIGQLLAEKLDLSFSDLDTLIEADQVKPISDIFRDKGEIYFRATEAKVLRTYVQNNDHTVLALGGGTPCYASNMELLNSSSNIITVFLKASVLTLANRLMKEQSKRPLLAHVNTEEAMLEFVGKHLFERNNYYNEAKLHISTDTKSPEQIVETIIKSLA